MSRLGAKGERQKKLGVSFRCLGAALETEDRAEQVSRSEVQIYLIIKIINTKTSFQCFVIEKNN